MELCIAPAPAPAHCAKSVGVCSHRAREKIRTSTTMPTKPVMRYRIISRAFWAVKCFFTFYLKRITKAVIISIKAPESSVRRFMLLLLLFAQRCGNFFNA